MFMCPTKYRRPVLLPEVYLHTQLGNMKRLMRPINLSVAFGERSGTMSRRAAFAVPGYVA